MVVTLRGDATDTPETHLNITRLNLTGLTAWLRGRQMRAVRTQTMVSLVCTWPLSDAHAWQTVVKGVFGDMVLYNLPPKQHPCLAPEVPQDCENFLR